MRDHNGPGDPQEAGAERSEPVPVNPATPRPPGRSRATARRMLSQRDASTATLSSVGAKAATLARLAGEGIPVPPFFVVPAAAFARHLRDNAIPWPPPADACATWRDQVRSSPMTPTLSRQILDGFELLTQASGHHRVAVRSSGSEEDSESASFAGRFSSTLNVYGSSLLEAVKDCWASYLSDRSLHYRAAHGIAFAQTPTFGVVVQTQVFAQKAGVMFTVHPVEPAWHVVYIEANFGTGESVVGGLVTPDSVSVSRTSTEDVEMVTATKRRMTAVSLQAEGSQLLDVDESQQRSPVLTTQEARELSAMGLRIEQLMERAQDIEWAYDSQQLWIVQARPITRRESQRG